MFFFQHSPPPNTRVLFTGPCLWVVKRYLCTPVNTGVPVTGAQNYTCVDCRVAGREHGWCVVVYRPYSLYKLRYRKQIKIIFVHLIADLPRNPPRWAGHNSRHAGHTEGLSTAKLLLINRTVIIIY